MINLLWLELPISRTNFYGPKDVRAIEVRLYTVPMIPYSPCLCYHIHCPHVPIFAVFMLLNTMSPKFAIFMLYKYVLRISHPIFAVFMSSYTLSPGSHIRCLYVIKYVVSTFLHSLSLCYHISYTHLPIFAVFMLSDTLYPSSHTRFFCYHIR